MDKQDFNLKAFNDSFDRALRGNELNFGKMLVQAYDEDLSVIGRYDPPPERVVFNAALEPETIEKADHDDPFYYGVSPLFDSAAVMRLLSSVQILSEEALDGSIEAHREWFMLHKGQGEYLHPMARYIMLSVAAHFGVRIFVSREQWAELSKEYENAGITGRALKTMVSYDAKTGVAALRGFITQQLFDIMSRRSYRPAEPPAEGTEPKAELVLAEEGKGELTLRDAYAQHLVLVRGRVFYSGTMLRPTRIEVMDSSHENDRVRSICIAFERTTYGTCCTLDGNLTAHPLLGGCRGKIVELLKKDDDFKRSLKAGIEALSEEESRSAKAVLGVVNEYLGRSFNVNQIGVSANIISNDGYLLLGRRNAASIDEGKLYPGVNGNAEIADRNVSFYGLSVYEDYPTIKTDDDRIDFFGEIGRETYGEIKQDLTKQEWICYGMIISGNMPEAEGPADDYTDGFRRMHFNLIFEHDCPRSMNEIELAARTAAEAFETKSFLGMAVRCEKNRAALLWRSIKRFVSAVVSQQDFIESLLAIIVFLPAVGKFISALKTHQSIRPAIESLFSEGWTGTAAIILAALVVAWTVVRVVRLGVRSFKAVNKVRFMRIYRSTPYSKVDRMLEKKLRMRIGKYLFLSARRLIARLRGKKLPPVRREFGFHPAAYAALRAYIDNKAHDSFFLKDRR